MYNTAQCGWVITGVPDMPCVESSRSPTTRPSPNNTAAIGNLWACGTCNSPSPLSWLTHQNVGLERFPTSGFMYTHMTASVTATIWTEWGVSRSIH
ncbi:hypothetical protein WJX73_001719 [Symbiochloris irregularis]|uniref:Uncharacterized protein n=1 Tax=Symbiochloris irregularis TaxID=706552 RepID=A0AAW1PM89_9CHLO